MQRKTRNIVQLDIANCGEVSKKQVKTADCKGFALVFPSCSFEFIQLAGVNFSRTHSERHHCKPPKDSKTRAELNDLQQEAGLQDLTEEQLGRFLGQGH